MKNKVHLHKTAKEMLHERNEDDFTDLMELADRFDIEYDFTRAALETAHELLQDEDHKTYTWLCRFAKSEMDIDIKAQMKLQRELVTEQQQARKEMQGWLR